MRDIRVANNKIAGSHGIFVIPDNITPVLGINVQEFQNVIVMMNHVRMLVTVLLIDEKYIHKLNIVHKTTPKIILADIILRRYDYLIKNLSREVKFGLGLVKYCKKKTPINSEDKLVYFNR